MNRTKKFITLLIIAPAIILGTLCGGNMKVNAIENTYVPTYKNDKYNKCPCQMRDRHLLKESVNELKENGILSEDDVKNINSYMTKEKEAKESEIKEKIYNAECEKIDKMVEGKVITKEKGEKLKAAVKENLQEIKKNMKQINSK